MQAGYFYTHGPSGVTHADTIVLACQRALRASHSPSLYDVLRAVCAPDASHLDIMRTCFAFMMVQMHYNKDATSAELYVPSYNPLGLAPHMCILFVTTNEDHKSVLDFTKHIIKPWCMALTHNALSITSLYGGFKRHDDTMVWGVRAMATQMDLLHNNKPCSLCVEEMVRIGNGRLVRDCTTTLLLPPQELSQQPSHTLTMYHSLNDESNQETVHVPIPRQFAMVCAAQIMVSGGMETLLPSAVFAHPPCALVLELVRNKPYPWSYAVAFVCANSDTGMHKLTSILYSIASGLDRLRSNETSLYWVCLVVGMFDPEPPLPWDNIIARCGRIREYTNKQYRMVNPFITGRVVHTVFTEPTEITNDNVEVLSMEVSTNKWMLHGFIGSNVQLNPKYGLSGLWDMQDRFIMNTFYNDPKGKMSGEHASCTTALALFIKWQLMFAFEVASIAPYTPPPVTDEVSKVVATLAPTHIVTLREGTGIEREYANYSKMAPGIFFCLPVLAYITKAPPIETLSAKRSPETHFRTMFGEFALVTLYADFGMTLKEFLGVTIFQHPFKAIMNMCLLFLARHEATKSLWPDMHNRNLTVRRCPAGGGVLSWQGLQLSFAGGEQIVCAIDHGDDTLSRGVLGINTAADACRVFNDTIRWVLTLNNADFTVGGPKERCDLLLLDTVTDKAITNEDMSASFYNEVLMCLFRVRGIDQSERSLLLSHKVAKGLFNPPHPQPFHFRNPDAYPCSEALQQAAQVWRNIGNSHDAIVEATRTLLPMCVDSFRTI